MAEEDNSIESDSEGVIVECEILSEPDYDINLEEMSIEEANEIVNQIRDEIESVFNLS